MAKPKIAILGLGSIGKRHMSNLMSMDYPVRGWDPAVQSKLNRYETVGGADAVIIASPTREHFEDMTFCKGKHLLVEKPMSFDAPAPLLQGFCLGKKSHGELVFVGNNLRFHHCVKEAKKMVDGGLVGKIGWAEFWVLQKSEKPVYLMDGVTRNWGAHEIDLSLHLLGPGMATEVKECKTVDGNDVDVEFTIQHENGAASFLHLDYLTDPERRGFRLCGSKGTIEADLVDRTIKVSNILVNSENKMKDSFDDNYKEEVLHFAKVVEAVMDGSSLKHIKSNLMLATGEDGAAVMDIILSVRSMAGLVDKPEEEK